MIFPRGVRSTTTTQPQFRGEYDASHYYTETVDANGDLTIVPSGGVVTISGALHLASALGVAYGGTGLASYAAGDVLYATGATTLAKLAAGASGRVLTSSGTAPQWSASIAYGALPSGGGTWANGGALSITGGVTTVAGLVSSAGATIANNLVVSGVGPHAFGAAILNRAQFLISGSFIAGATGAVFGLRYTGNLKPLDASGADGVLISPTLQTHTSGTHALFAGVRMAAPGVTLNGAAVTEATTLYVVAAPVGATNNYAVHVAAGTALFDGPVTISASGSFTSVPAAAIFGSYSGNTALTVRSGAAGLARFVFEPGVANNRGFIDYDANTFSFGIKANETLVMTVAAGAVTLAGTLGVTGVTTLATSLTGPLRADSGVVSIAAGVGTKTLFDHFADANNGTTVETDLYSDTIPAARLAANGEKLEAQYAGIYTGDATSTQRVKAYFGGTLVFDSGALAIGLTTPTWECLVTVIRVSASVVRCAVSYTSSFAALGATSTYTEVTGLTLANTQVLKITGTAAGATGASNQITAKESYVQWLPAA